MRRDRRVLGNYLRKPDNLFAWLQTGVVGIDFIRALQAAGAVRSDIDPGVIAHLIDLLGYGQLSIGEYKPAEQSPPIETIMEVIAEMVDRQFSPADGGNSDAGKTVIRQIVTTGKARVIDSRKTFERASHEME
jgi:TetR/AcrR family acrAB operon transcriptional repressor